MGIGLAAQGPVSSPVEVTTGREAAGRRYHGVVKWWRGSWGWLECRHAPAKWHGRDIFLHKMDCKGVAPGRGDCVSFCLTSDDRGNPKAVEAQVEGPPASSEEVVKIISARDWF